MPKYPTTSVLLLLHNISNTLLYSLAIQQAVGSSVVNITVRVVRCGGVIGYGSRGERSNPGTGQAIETLHTLLFKIIKDRFLF